MQLCSVFSEGGPQTSYNQGIPLRNTVPTDTDIVRQPLSRWQHAPLGICPGRYQEGGITEYIPVPHQTAHYHLHHASAEDSLDDSEPGSRPHHALGSGVYRFFWVSPCRRVYSAFS